MSDTLLNYAINPSPNPIQASPKSGNVNTATLTLAVSNSSGDIITCKSITLSYLMGTNAEDLSSDGSGTSVAFPTGWTPRVPSGGIYIFTPDTAKAGQIGGQGLTFAISGIKVNQESGPFTITIAEDAADPDAVPEQPEEVRNKYIQMAKFPAEFTVGDLLADPPAVQEGDSTTLSWSGSGSSGNYTATYQIQYVDGNGNRVTIDHPKNEPNQPLPPVGSYKIDNLVTNPTVFYLNVQVQVTGNTHPLLFRRTAVVTVVQPQPTIDYFNIEADPIVSGQQLSFTLSWSVAHVADFQVVANDGPSGQWRRLDVPFSLQGKYIVYPRLLQTTYQMQVLSSSLEEEEMGG
jgi:hypothetical protein